LIPNLRLSKVLGCEIFIKVFFWKFKRKERKDFFELIENIFKVRKDISLNKDFRFIYNKKERAIARSFLIYH